MNKSFYKELFSLIRDEGERLVVIDPDNDDGLVVIKLSEYKRLRDFAKADAQQKQPTLAQISQKDLSFWDTAPKEEEALKSTSDVREPSSFAPSIDKEANSGRIHERKSAKVSPSKAKQPLQSRQNKQNTNKEEEAAGGEYYFEPAEEIGL